MLWALCLTLVLVDFVGDVVTGPEMAWSIFYVVPIAIAAWHLGRRPGLAMVVAASVSWLVADQLAGATYAVAVVQYWNAAVRASLFLIVAYAVTLLRHALDHERALARTDLLTGLPNTRSFLEILNHEIARARRRAAPLSLAYLDLDGFKAVNDTLGHAAGDRLIHDVAGALRDAVRDVDTVARLGGDEFGVLMPDTDRDSAQRVLDRLRPAVTRAAAADGQAIGFSAGVFTSAAPPDAETMIRLADAAMYDAKRHGGAAAVHSEAGGT